MEIIFMQSSRLLIVLALLLACPALTSAQLRFTQPVVNLGDLRGGPVYSHRFEFVNDSAKPIEIVDFRLGCGCLQPLLDQRVYQPGEKGTLHINIRTLGQPQGGRTWQAQVQYRDAGMPAECAIAIGANLHNEISVEPSIVAMTVETALRQEITIKDHRKSPMKIISVRVSTPAIGVIMQPTSGGITKVTIEVSRAGLTAAKQDELLTIYTDDPHYRHLQVPIMLTKAQRNKVSAAPDNVSLIGAGSQIVRLRGIYDQRVRIEKVNADHRAISCTYAAGPGDDATLKIVVNAAMLTSPSVVATVTVHCAEPAGTVLTVPVLLRKE
jgi:hypothetical protein